jgi:hypothetical protein
MEFGSISIKKFGVDSSFDFFLKFVDWVGSWFYARVWD